MDAHEVIASGLVDVYLLTPYKAARQVLDALAAAGILLTEPDRGDVIVRPSDCVPCCGHGDLDGSFGFDACLDCRGTGRSFVAVRVRDCSTCGDDGEVAERINDRRHRVEPCPECTGWTLARTAPFESFRPGANLRVTEVYSPTRKDA